LILVLCGTQNHQFKRLIEESKKLLQYDSKIIVQAGHTRYQDEDLEIFDFMDSKDLELIYDQADWIITHAGAGSLIKGIRRNKKIIAFPRLEKYHEHVNDHQIELTTQLSKKGYVIAFEDGNDICELYEKNIDFVASEYNEPSNIIEIVEEFLKEV